MGRGRGGKGSGPWRWLRGQQTGKELSCSQRSIHIYQTEPRIKTNKPSFSLCHISSRWMSAVAVSDFLSFSSRLTPAPLVCRHPPFFPPRFPLILCRPCFCWPTEHIKMLPTPHCPDEVRDQLDSYETIWNTHRGGRSGLKNGLYVTWGKKMEAQVIHQAKPAMKPQLSLSTCTWHLTTTSVGEFITNGKVYWRTVK